MAFEYNTSRDPSGFGRVSAASAATIDAGLRAHMLRVYNYMGIGLGLTGLTAWGVYAIEPLRAIFFAAPMSYVAMFAPLAFVLALSFGINRMSSSTAKATFFGYAAVMGLSMATIFAVYSKQSIALTFFVTASTFLAMSLWGYTTKRDLTGLGHFMVMGLIGIVIASLANLFMASSALEFAISVGGVVIFTGLTAWDTQKIKQMYAEANGYEGNQKLAVMGALALYLDFINLFMFLLRFLGRKE